MGGIMARLRLTVVCDLVEENWPSMDLVAEMLLKHLRTDHADSVWAKRMCPPMICRFGRVPLLRNKSPAFNIDRLLNRFWDYPRRLRERLRSFDFFHVCDHSYSHLVHSLPEE